MKKIILIAGLLAIFSLWGFSQNNAVLEVRNYKTHKSRFIKESSKVKIKEAAAKYKGRLTVLSDHSILVDSDTVLLSQIQGINSRTTSSTFGGIGLLVPGAILGSFGTWGFVTVWAELASPFIGAIIFAPIAAVGIFGTIIGVQLLSNGKKFSSWKYEYKTIIPFPAQALK